MKKLLALALLFTSSISWALPPDWAVNRWGNSTAITDANGNTVSYMARSSLGTTIVDSDGIRTFTNASTPVIENGKVAMSKSVPLTLEGGALKQKVSTSILDKISIPKEVVGAAAGRFLYQAGAIAVGTIIADIAIEAGHRWLSDQQKWVHSVQGPQDCWRDARYSQNGEEAASSSSCIHASAMEACQHMAQQPPYVPNADYTFEVTGAVGTQCAFAATPKTGGASFATYSTAGSLVAYQYNQAAHDVDSTQEQLAQAITSTPNDAQLLQVPKALADNGQSLELSGNEEASYTPSQSVIELPEVVVKTSMKVNPDGSTSAVTTKEKQTLTAHTAGGSVTNNYFYYGAGTTTNNYNQNGDLIDSTTETPKPNPAPETQPDDEDCAQGDPTCSPGSLTKPTLDEVPTIAESTASLKSRIEASALVSSLTGLAAALPSGGSCPTFDLSTDFRGYSYGGAITAHCTIFGQNYGAIHGIFLCAFALSAVILFFKA